MTKPYLNEEEKMQYEICLKNIEDKLNALKAEAKRDRPYKYYIKEKIDIILWDSRVIKDLTTNESN